MKLPIQALPVSRKSGSTMLSKEATNGVGASSECDSACGWAAAACAASVPTGYLGIAACLATIGAAGCYDCVLEILQMFPSGGPGGCRTPSGAQC
jgi:hypothetical protein